MEQQSKLELKHLAPYLPYGLRIKEDTGEYSLTGSYLDNIIEYPGLYSNVKPLLIPLSELTKEQYIEVFKAGCKAFAETENDKLMVEGTDRFIKVEYHQWTTRVSMRYGFQE